jgi:hypothetical protein
MAEGEKAGEDPCQTSSTQRESNAAENGPPENFHELITLNVGGTHFTTRRDTVQKVCSWGESHRKRHYAVQIALKLSEGGASGRKAACMKFIRLY